VERAKDGIGMTESRSFDNSTYKRVLDLLEAGCLRLGKVVVRSIRVIKFGVTDAGGSDRGCYRIEVKADTAELVNNSRMTSGVRR